MSDKETVKSSEVLERIRRGEKAEDHLATIRPTKAKKLIVFRGEVIEKDNPTRTNDIKLAKRLAGNGNISVAYSRDPDKPKAKADSKADDDKSKAKSK